MIQDVIQACEIQTNFLYVNGNCIDCSLAVNCEICIGTLSNNICNPPTIQSCQRPGYLMNEMNLCYDCRTQDQCVQNCDGFWDTQLLSCIRFKEFLVQSYTRILCSSIKTRPGCFKCAHQRYYWSSTLLRCLKCSLQYQWDRVNLTCSQQSTCSDPLLNRDPTSGTCLDCITIVWEDGNSMLCQCSGAFYLDENNNCLPCDIQVVYVMKGMFQLINVLNALLNIIQVVICCALGFYLELGLCIACSTLNLNCLTCNSSKVCLSCTKGYSLVNSECVCDTVSQNFIVKSGYCEECLLLIEGCSKCILDTVTNIERCNTCVDSYVLSSNFTCIQCTIGQYRLGEKCLNCADQFCAKCNEISCFKCRSTFTQDAVSKKCTCDKVVNLQTLKCQTCAEIFGYLCTQCASSGCSQCSLPNYTPNKFGCQCINGNIIISDNSCKLCPQNCSACTLSNDCTVCQTGFYLFKNNTCQPCGAHKYYISSLKACANCNTNCMNCAIETGACTGPCDKGFTLSNSECICQAALRLILDGECVLCQQKVPNCFMCRDALCTKCETGFKLMDNNTCGNCLPGQYYIKGKLKCLQCFQCSQCNDETGTCVSEDKCLNGFYLDQITKFCSCNYNKVLINASGQCDLCSLKYPQCEICDSTLCLKCLPDFRLMIDNKCEKCQDNEYYISSSKLCYLCPTNCTQCIDESGICTGDCLNNNILVSGSCVCQIDRALVKQGDLQICEMCSNLINNCLQCDGPNFCLKCSKNFQISRGECRNCESFELNMGGNCVACNVLMNRCNTCKSETLCDKCYDTFQKKTDEIGKDTCICPKGSYIQPRTAQGNEKCLLCTSFDPYCMICTQVNVCQWCQNTYHYNKTAKKCIQCTPNEYYLTSEPEKTFQKCINCNSIHPKCIQCTPDAKCKSCSDNYENTNYTCQCINDRLLMYKNSLFQCILCREAIDPLCSQCSDQICNKCEKYYYLSSDYKRCLPEILITFKETSGEPLSTVFEMNIKAAIVHLNANPILTIYLYNSKQEYYNEIKSKIQLQQDYDLKKNYLYAKFDLNNQKNLFNIDNDSNQIQRSEKFMLHEGQQYLVYTILDREITKYPHYVTTEMQLLNQETRDPQLIVLKFIESDNFNTKADTKNMLFLSSEYESLGRKLRYGIMIIIMANIKPQNI
ncbi:zinc finger lsd1 subclass family protein, putative [Ichthyophthirius multifiliis]|uniref:Zinc finger lsd1 subclass family protein, putative n=1 Tax=Ichthyophthirius multifiliis TaxID=5932 RepID=G0QYG3_ICHMU|nr:zinc finger lsd1 subclass family protein, putative [Ichthyophthirius multifiliis]EGR29749.1 zinc finger lsd1 subclass family protein, putative [Ichthyophthirius multifiliis]|eukprot:XP_004030985.1 zinc finger lsd1 subclass family protein, putative [Ichthyophthirius multifiliis]